MKHRESIMQREAVKWFRLQYPKLKLIAIPNGGKRGKIEAAIMKAEGVLAGAADLFLIRANENYYGLWIEMKTETGKLTASQMRFRDYVVSEGFQYVVCRSLDQFMELVTNYLKQ